MRSRGEPSWSVATVASEAKGKPDPRSSVASAPARMLRSSSFAVPSASKSAAGGGKGLSKSQFSWTAREVAVRGAKSYLCQTDTAFRHETPRPDGPAVPRPERGALQRESHAHHRSRRRRSQHPDLRLDRARG